MERITKHLSYANVAATLALVFGMSGGAIAATGGFTSGGTLKACVNGEGGLKLLKAGKHCKRGQKTVAWNQTGPAGAPGATGATGAAGAAGPIGPKGLAGKAGEDALANIVVRTATVENLIAGSHTVDCEPGERAIAGGASANFSNGAKLYGSAPINEEGREAAEGETPTGWATGLEAVGPAKTTVFYAICAS